MGRGTSPAWSLLALLVAYGVLAILPMLAGGAYLLFRVAQAERSQLEERVQQIAAAVAGDVERELQRRLTVLETLATSPRISQGDLAGFYAQAKAAVAKDGLGVILHDATSRQQLVNTLVDFGTPLPTTGDPETFDRVITAKGAQISDVFPSLVSKAPAIDIALPVLRGGKVRHVLKLALAPEHFRQILGGQQLDPQWTLTIIDRRGTIVARSRDHEALAGTTLPPAQLAQLRNTAATFASTNLQGQPVLAALARVPSADWRVRVSAPFDVAQGPLNRSLLALTAAAIAAALFTTVLGTFFAARISKPLTAVAEMAQTLVHGKPPVQLPRAYKEANFLGAALEDAGAELAKLRQREKLVVSESSHRVKNILAVVQSLVQQTLRGEQQASSRAALTRRLGALARAQDALTSNNWHGASLHQIVAAEMSPYAGRFTMDGPPVDIAAAMAQTFSLLLHELATNAAKHGALSNGEGRVSVNWTIEGLGDTAWLKFSWRENGGPIVAAPAQKGFGSALLEAALPSQEGPRLRFAPEGFTYEIDMPLLAISTDAKASQAGL